MPRDSTRVIRFSEAYDAEYYADTGEWVDPPCSNPECRYCSRRPERFPISQWDRPFDLPSLPSLPEIEPDEAALAAAAEANAYKET